MLRNYSCCERQNKHLKSEVASKRVCVHSKFNEFDCVTMTTANATDHHNLVPLPAVYAARCDAMRCESRSSAPYVLTLAKTESFSVKVALFFLKYRVHGVAEKNRLEFASSVYSVAAFSAGGAYVVVALEYSVRFLMLLHVHSLCNCVI